MNREERIRAEELAYREWDLRRPDCCGKRMIWQPADGTFYCSACKMRQKPKE